MTVLSSGDLATPRRSVMGILAHLVRLEWTPDEQHRFLVDAGLPPLALDQPDITISLAQEVACLERVISALPSDRSVVGQAVAFARGIEVTSYGVLGLAMLYAPSLLACAELSVRHPELCWGHCRVTFRLDDGVVQELEVPPVAFGARYSRDLWRYVTAVDLTASLAIARSVLAPEDTLPMRWVELPWPAPHDHEQIRDELGCPVTFDASRAAIRWDASVAHAAPRLANPLVFRAYVRQTEAVASLLRAELQVREQVRRLLSTARPVPDRAATARMLAMSPRTLARRLGAEGVSFTELSEEIRLARATRALQRRDVTVAEVAESLGFADATAFSRAFRRWTGHSPSTWRRNATR